MIETNSRDEDITLREVGAHMSQLWRHLLAHKLCILSFAIAGLSLGYVYGKFSPKPFIATTTFVLEEESANAGQYSGLAAIAGLSLPGGNGGLFQGNNLIELYKSRSMLKTALLKRGDRDGVQIPFIVWYADMTEMSENWTPDQRLQFSRINPLNPGFLADSVISSLVKRLNQKHLVVEKSEDSGTIRVVVEAVDENFAKQFNDELVSTVNQFYIDTRTRKTSENVTVLSRQTDSVRRALDRAIVSSAANVDATPNLNAARQRLRVPVQKSQYNLQTNAEMIAELVKNLELAKIGLQKQMPLIQIIDGPVLPLERKGLGTFACMLIGACSFLLISSTFYILKYFYNLT